MSETAERVSAAAEGENLLERSFTPLGIVLRAVVYFHIFAVFTWSLPSPPPELRVGIKQYSSESIARNWSAHLLHWNEMNFKGFPFKTYLRFIGAEQNWNMFAPHPVTTDIYVDAVVKFQDGSEQAVSFPRGSQMTQSERFFKERYRKYIETVHQETASILWPELANYMARRAYIDHLNPPVFVELYRHARPVAHPGEPKEEGYQSHKFFETPVIAEVL